MSRETPETRSRPEQTGNEPQLVEQKISLALQHHQAGRLAEAALVYQEVLERDAGNINALHLLGVIAYQQGDYARAVALITQALSRNATNAPAHSNLGNALAAQGRREEAIVSYRRAIALQPDYVDAHVNCAGVFRTLGKREEAIACYRKALVYSPGAWRICFDLASLLIEEGRLDEAIACYRRAIEIKPDFPEAHSNLGTALREQGRLNESLVCYRRALALRSDFVEAHYNLGNALKDVGQLDEAVQSYREALHLAPGHADARTNLVCALNYVPGLPPADIFAEHRACAVSLCVGNAPQRYDNIPDPARKLRIGYVSGDFRKHPVAHFMEPVLARHDRGQFEIFCYYNHPNADDVTLHLRSRADAWRDVSALSDDALARRIRDDAIDILIDLSGYTAHHRLSVFGRKPAPVQATWLGYLNTTGLDTIDYRITDRYASPEGMFDAFHSERLLRLPDSQWCYQPPKDCPEISGTPGALKGVVTFGAFSNLAKIGPSVIELWSRLLLRVSDSRLLIVGPGLASIRDEYLQRFTRHGIAAERMDLREALPFHGYLESHREVDVMLDTFPYTGGTTTCHALWMGVPVVSLAGETAPSRGGTSILNAVGLGELVANTSDEYLDIATGLAHDPARLGALRSGMRSRMAASALMDVQGFTRNLERAYRSMWKSWCEKC